MTRQISDEPTATPASDAWVYMERAADRVTFKAALSSVITTLDLAVNTAVPHLAGSETFTGAKTFAAGLTTLTGLSLDGGKIVTDGSGNETMTVGNLTLNSGYFVGDGSLLTNLPGSPVQSDSTIYIATTGSDTNAGTSGAPYLTMAKAMTRIPQRLTANWTISVADGTYAEGIDLRGLNSATDKTLTIQGNTSSIGNVIFTGTIPVGSTSIPCGIAVDGALAVNLNGIKSNVSTTTGSVLTMANRCQVTVDRCILQGQATNAVDKGVFLSDYSWLIFKGNCTVNNWGTEGIEAVRNCQIQYSSAGTLTISRPDSFGNGIHLAYHSQMICDTANTNITISGAIFGFQLGLNSIFQHLGSSSTITCSNGGTPTASAGVNATDCSSWSTNQKVVLSHFTWSSLLQAISYAEATGSTAYSNTGSASVTQNSVSSGI